jgi:hypothetical protein
MARDVPATVTLSLVAAAPDELWSRLRPALLANLRAGARLTELWKALPGAMETDAEDRLAARLLADAEFADTFLLIEEAETALSIREPAFAPLLGRYVDARVRDWPKDSELLLTAASHALPEVREPALGRILVVGMSLPFALRLLESQVPDAVRVSERFFENHKIEDGFPFALALCDSPVAAVRAYGRRFVSARWDALPRQDLYRALFENPAPEMQAFVATLLGDEPAPPAEAAQFDGEVLRAKNRARRAKEAVKARQGKADAPTVDVDTLLALARGVDGTPRDAEWALTQLTRLALSGQKIEGFAVVEG